MQPSLFLQIEQVRRRLWRRRLAAVTYWALAAAIVAAIALTGLDRALETQDLPGRVLLTALGACVVAVICHKWYREVTAGEMSPLDVALCVERRYPELRDEVTSALDFSTQAEDDPTAGSPSLRRAVVLRAATAVEEVDWQQFVLLRPLRGAALACAGVLAVFAALAWWMPQAVGTGLVRLTNPLSEAEWPREHHLEFVDPPTKLAAGDDLILQLRDARGSLPGDTQIHYRIWRHGKWSEQSEPLAVTGETHEIRRASVSESLEYRATGGDHHTMPWHKLEVIPPPRISSLAVTLHPPDYTGLGEISWIEGGHVLEGSRLDVRGETDRPLVGVALGSDGGRLVSGSVERDDRGFHVTLDCEDSRSSGEYFFEFTTPEGLTTRAARHLVIDVTPDESPQVSFLEPTVDRLSVVPWATLPLVIEAHDDLALASIALVVRRSDRSEQGDQTVPLWNSPGVGATRKQLLEYDWPLAPFGLPPGSIVEVHAQASDFCPTTGQTPYPLKVTIITERALLQELGEREAMLLEVVERTLREQRKLHARITDWDDPSTWTSARIVNESHDVLFGQRRISDALVGSSDSVNHTVVSLKMEVRRNDLDRPELMERLSRMQASLDELAKGPLPDIDQSLGDLVRLLQRGDSHIADAEPNRLIIATQQRQQQVIGTLERMLESLSMGTALARIERDLAALADDQGQMAEHCQELSLDWLSENSTASRNKLELAAGGQRQLATRLAELTSRMTELSEKLADSQPPASARLADTADQARELELQMKMRTAAERLALRHVGRATTLQSQAEDGLCQLCEGLAGSRTGNRSQGGERGDGKSKRLTQSRPGNSNSGSSPATVNSPGTSDGSDDLAASLEATGDLVRDLWGHLPERQRQQILQPLSEDFLPKYSAEIEEYFRALADPERRTSESP